MNTAYAIDYVNAPTTPAPVLVPALPQSLGKGDLASNLGLRFIDMRIETWDVAIATYHTQINPYRRQRKLTPSNLKKYSRDMQEGFWIPAGGHSISIAVLPDGTEVLFNGYHRCESIIKTGLPQMFKVERYRVSNLEEIAEFVKIWDINAPLKPGDKLRLYMPDDARFTESTIGNYEKKLDAAIYVLRNGGSTNSTLRMHGKPAMEEMLNYQGASRLYVSCLPKTNFIPYLRAPVLAAGILMCHLRGSRDLAMELFTMASHDSGLEKGTPERALNDYVLQRDAKDNQRTDWAKDNDKLRFGKIVGYYNWKFRKNTKLSNKHTEFLALDGTPLNGTDCLLLRGGELVGTFNGPTTADANCFPLEEYYAEKKRRTQQEEW